MSVNSQFQVIQGVGNPLRTQLNKAPAHFRKFTGNVIKQQVVEAADAGQLEPVEAGVCPVGFVNRESWRCPNAGRSACRTLPPFRRADKKYGSEGRRSVSMARTKIPQAPLSLPNFNSSRTLSIACKGGQTTQRNSWGAALLISASQRL